MHEVSIANSLVDAVTEALIRQNAERVVRVTVEVGALSGVAPAALRSAFVGAIRDTPLEGAVLDLREIGVRIWCDACHGERPAKSIQRVHCSDCDSPAARVVNGRELDIVSIEVVDAAENSGRPDKDSEGQ